MSWNDDTLPAHLQLPKPGTPERAKADAEHAAMVAGLLKAAAMRPVVKQ